MTTPSPEIADSAHDFLDKYCQKNGYFRPALEPHLNGLGETPVFVSVFSVYGDHYLMALHLDPMVLTKAVPACVQDVIESCVHELRIGVPDVGEHEIEVRFVQNAIPPTPFSDLLAVPTYEPKARPAIETRELDIGAAIELTSHFLFDHLERKQEFEQELSEASYEESVEYGLSVRVVGQPKDDPETVLLAFTVPESVETNDPVVERVVEGCVAAAHERFPELRAFPHKSFVSH